MELERKSDDEIQKKKLEVEESFRSKIKNLEEELDIITKSSMDEQGKI